MRNLVSCEVGGMSRKDFARVLDRVVLDSAFREQLRDCPLRTLAGIGIYLTGEQAEVAARKLSPPAQFEDPDWGQMI